MEVEDDSCSICGHISVDGRVHINCPVECSNCGHIGVYTYLDGCPLCNVVRSYEGMNEIERGFMKDLLKD